MAPTGLPALNTPCSTAPGPDDTLPTDVSECTDYFSNIPTDVLVTINSLLCGKLDHGDWQQSDISSAAAWEATTKQLGRLLRKCARFSEVIVNASFDQYSLGTSDKFWRWLAAHGHQVEHLIFSNVSTLSFESLGCLCARPGASEARRVTVHADWMDSLEPLEGMLNLEHLSGNTDYPPSGFCPDDPLSLRPLQQLTALKSLDLGHMCAAERDLSDTDCLASLTNLTSLCLDYMGDLHSDSLHFLASHGSNLQRLTLGDFRQLDSLQPLVALTSLTYLDLRWPYRRRVLTTDDALEPLSSLRSLKHLCLAGDDSHVHDSSSSSDDDGAPMWRFDILPLGTLRALETLDLCHFQVRTLQPITACTALTELAVYDHYRNSDEDADSIRALSALRKLTLYRLNIPNNMFLLPLTNLECLHVLDMSRIIGTRRDWWPIFELTRLTRLHLEDCCRGWVCLRALPAEFSQLENLRVLSLDLGQCVVRSVAALGTLAALTKLRLEVNRERVKGLEVLTTLTALKRLEVG
jgi:hypothetical protein